MVVLMRSGIAIANVNKIEEGVDDYALVFQKGEEEPRKIPIDTIAAIHTEW